MPVEKGKSGLSKRQLKEFEQGLLTQKKQLQGALNRAEVSNCDQNCDYGDRGNSEQSVALTLAEQSRKKKDLALVVAALERIKKGTFGICQSHDCDGDGSISFLRLKAMPTAIHCIECMTEKEKNLKK